MQPNAFCDINALWKTIIKHQIYLKQTNKVVYRLTWDQLHGETYAVASAIKQSPIIFLFVCCCFSLLWNACMWAYEKTCYRILFKPLNVNCFIVVADIKFLSRENSTSQTIKAKKKIVSSGILMSSLTAIFVIL